MGVLPEVSLLLNQELLALVLIGLEADFV